MKALGLVAAFVLLAGCGPHIDPRVRAACAEVGNPRACEQLHQADLAQFEAQERAQMAARQTAPCAADPDPNGCVLTRMIALMAVADEPAPPVYQQPPPQRVFIRRFALPNGGTWPTAAPLGYMDLP